MTLADYNYIDEGNCIDLLKLYPENCFDMIYADPPYNLNIDNPNALTRPDGSTVNSLDADWDKFDNLDAYETFTYNWLSQCRRVLKPDGTLWVGGTYHNIYLTGYLLRKLSFWTLNDVVWIKNNPMPNFKGTRFTNAHETLLWVAKHKSSKYTFNYQAMKQFNNGKQMRSDWYLPICTGAERLKDELGNTAHRTQKPELLLQYIIIASTNPGDLILDPFFGVGTTGVVASRLGRRWIGMESDPTYTDWALARLNS